MGFESILDLKEPVKGVTRPAFFLDLNIDQIIERVTKKDRKTAEYYEYFPLDAECESYRHEIYNDIWECGLYDVLSKFVSRYNEFREIEHKKKTTRIQLQIPVWHFCGMEIYTGNLLMLQKTLSSSAIKSEGFRLLKEYLDEYMGTAAFKDMAERSAKLKRAIDALEVEAGYVDGRIIVSVEDVPIDEEKCVDEVSGESRQFGRVKEKAGEKAEEKVEKNAEEENEEFEYEDFLKAFNDINSKEFVNPFAVTDELTSFEQEIMKIVTKRNPEIFKEAEKLFDQTEEYENEVFGRLADELKFYLAYYEFEDKMKNAGFCFAAPGNQEDKGLSADG